MVYNFTLTSAITRPHTIPKTTKFMKRRNMDSILFKAAPQIELPAIDRRKISPDEIWNWDYWCKLQFKTGKCFNFTTRYYYDIQIDQCVNFTYSGCDGNKNNFNSAEICEQHCHGTTYLSIKEETPNYCALQQDAGICLALVRMYYYDINKDDCRIFHYGGCGGNRNRFNTKLNCLNDCKELK
ncbi:PREDICTED: kunitz-type serine protease inhibitor A-like [Papilio polytes]|uniref:kunitz-type serine protease inhibitor A-like n=1 Tax=Papilio polytes TaxID=76194 RepID=UPI000675C5E2|nr:PREDICTED: kunitz-type serine protease inhibitor A-like [Papilio polytes]